MKPTKRRFAVVTAYVILFCCSLLCVVYSLAVAVDALIIRNVAERLSGDPSLAGIYRYVEESIRIGMSRSEVETTLQHVASIDVQHGEFDRQFSTARVCERIRLRLGILTSWDVYACYDKHEQLVKYKIDND